jgi:hypothetical protein
MTQDEIIDMAREAGIIHPEMVAKHLEAFAKLVAAKNTKSTPCNSSRNCAPPSSHWKVWARARPQMNGLIFW